MAAFSTTTTAVPRRMAYLTSLQDLLPFMSQPIIDHIVTPLHIDFLAQKPSRDCSRGWDRRVRKVNPSLLFHKIRWYLSQFLPFFVISPFDHPPSSSLLPPLLRVSEVGFFRLDEYICANKNKGKYFVAFEVAEQFSAEICFVTLCYLRHMKRKVSRGITVGKPPLHLSVSHAVSILTGFAENELLEWGRTFSGFWGSENSGV